MSPGATVMYDQRRGSPQKVRSGYESPTRRMYRGFSLEHILNDITNFEGLEAETQASWKSILGSEYLSKRAQSMETLSTTPFNDSRSVLGLKSPRLVLDYDSGNFKNMLSNDNIVIIDKTPNKVRRNDLSDRRDGTIKRGKDNKDSKKITTCELPEPNTVSRFKSIFETMSTKSFPPKSGNAKAVGRSQSVKVTNADWRQRTQTTTTCSKETNNNDSGMASLDLSHAASTTDDKRCNTLPARLETHPNYEVEAARDWLNACSPVSSDVIQKIRDCGTSMTFFGRPAYTPSPSPTNRSSSASSPYGEADWRKPRIIGVTPKHLGKSPSSLSSSSTCSDDEYGGWHYHQAHPTYNGGDSRNGYYYYDDELDFDEDKELQETSLDYSYDVVHLNGTYSRSTTPKMGLIHKGVWLRDPYWHGSSYIIYDFRGTNVKPHISTKLP